MAPADNSFTLREGSMSTRPHCPAGHPLPAPGADCPLCHTPVYADRVPLPSAGGALPDVPGYEVLGELGRGGMGVVYKARHRKLDRLVALKMIASGALAGPQERERFLAEARTVARLQHPGIVQVFEVGEHEGRPFFAMEFVDGGSLAQKINGSPQPPLASAVLAETIARAMHAAHEQSVVHRDLKPANVLLSRSGEAKLTDFGLAKLLHGEPDRTESGAVVGTPGYMAPEQAVGKSRSRPFGPAVDVYGLGAILYELLTGRPPFLGETALEALQQVLSAAPLPPARLRPGLPRDLETICLKCLEKEPWRRYPTARAVAEDLGRFLNHEPIRARPPGPVGRLTRWCRRHPTTAGLLSALAAVVVLGFAAVTAAWLDADYQRGQKDIEATAANSARALADSEAKAKGLEVIAKEEERAKAVKARADADAKARDLGVANTKLEASFYISLVNLAYREWQANSVQGALNALNKCPEHLRGWEWHFVNRLCHAEASSLDAGWMVECLARSRDNRVIAAGTGQGDVTVWVRLQPGKHLAFPRGPSFRPPDQFGLSGVEVAAVAVSPDGKRIAAASRPQRISFLGDGGRDPSEVKVWEEVGAREVLSVPGPTNALSFSPDGTLLALGRGDGGVEVWDVAAKKLTATLKGQPGPVWCIAFSPDGKQLAGGGMAGVVTSWDVQTGKELASRRAPGMVRSVAFSEDGTYFAAASDPARIDVWETKDPADARPVQTLRGHAGLVRSICFSPDAPVLASASDDRTVKLWRLDTGADFLTLRGHVAPVTGVLFTPDGKQVMSGGGDGQVKFWDASEEQEAWSRRGMTAAVSPAGDFVATTRLARRSPLDEGAREVWVYDLHTGREVRAFRGHKEDVQAVTIGPGGKLAASASGLLFSGEILVWELATGKEVKRLPRGDVTHLAFSPDGRTLASVNAERRGFDRSGETITFWDLDAGKEVWTVGLPDVSVKSLAFSPDGKLLAVAGAGMPVKLLDARTGQEVLILHGGGGSSASFSPDGRWLLTTGGGGHDGGHVSAWDVATGRLEWELTGHSDEIVSAALSPDGKRLATAGLDGLVRLWDTALRQEIIALPHPGVLNGVAFSPDGNVLVSTSGDFLRPGYTKIWNAAPVRQEKGR